MSASGHARAIGGRIALFHDLLSQQYQNPHLREESIASTLRMSRTHLSRLLKQFTGCGFAAHLRRVRLAAARRLLANPTLSIKEIAFLAGYRHTSQLDRHFRQELGMTPSAYRFRDLVESATEAESSDGR